MGHYINFTYTSSTQLQNSESEDMVKSGHDLFIFVTNRTPTRSKDIYNYFPYKENCYLYHISNVLNPDSNSDPRILNAECPHFL